MTQRASFTTEYVYCPRCFDAVREVFGDEGVSSEHGYTAIPSIPLDRSGIKPAPIIAGALYSSIIDGEYLLFEFAVREMLEPKLCHPVRAVILPDGCDAAPVLIVWEPLSSRD